MYDQQYANRVYFWATDDAPETLAEKAPGGQKGGQ